jgi:hypothetical protein
MDADANSGRDAATTVGLITLPIGVALVVTPAQAARLLRLGDHSRALRVIGAADLALVPGLLAGRHRWQWMAARVGLNLVIAAYCLRLVRRERAAGAKVGVLAMVIATVDDGRRIAALRRARSPG